MIQRKVCMLGSFSVGKTSLVRRFVHSIFSDEYKTTIGVKLEKKVVEVEGSTLHLVLWDLHGDDEFQRIRTSYLRGMHAFFLVVDPTRPATLERARDLRRRVATEVGELPHRTLLNKADLRAEWAVPAEELQALEAEGWGPIETSAKTGAGVEQAFQELARATL